MQMKSMFLATVVSILSQVAMADTYVTFNTNQGEIEIKLYDDKAPISAKNFKNYAESGFYDKTIFHRVIPGFVIQGGGFTEAMEQKSTKPPIKNEANNGLLNKRGTLSMARTQDPNSATSQFFINLEDNTSLDYSLSTGNAGYAVFGEVTKGLNVVDLIAKQRTGRNGHHSDVPLKPIQIISTKVKSKK